ncbi:MAG: hypothetical protein PVH00_11915 [Gemmatimonadota bacterium]|jgi:hypothetical protein
MASSRINWHAAVPVLAALAAAGYPSGHVLAQRVLDLPVRESGAPDVLATGPIAVFWNPGGGRVPVQRGEALVVDVQGPHSTTVDGVALAAVFRLDPATAIGVGFRHVGLDEIPLTSTSPLPDDVEGALDISETMMSVAATRVVGRSLSFGASAHFTRAARALDAEDEVELGIGLRTAAANWTPGIGASVGFGEQGTEWAVGAELAPAVAEVAGGTFSLSYGIVGSPWYRGVSHRVALGAGWASRVRISAGLASEPDVGGRSWDPVLGAIVDISRYSVGFLHEELANGIGAVHTFRLGVTF